jgi:hypothetical protein
MSSHLQIARSFGSEQNPEMNLSDRLQSRFYGRAQRLLSSLKLDILLPINLTGSAHSLSPQGLPRQSSCVNAS